MKICSKCKIEKDLDQYGKKSRNKDGLSYYCKFCVSLDNKFYKEKKREIYNNKSKEYYQNNKEYFSEKAREYKDNNKDKLVEYNREYMKKYYIDSENRLKRSEYRKNKKETDNIYRISTAVRSLIIYSIKNRKYDKKNKTIEILGCTYEEFIEYIESKFEDWMIWENHGLYNGELNYGWDLDHIIPISTAKTEEEVILLNHYTNFQPLCSYVNRYIKKDRLDYKKN